MQLKSRFWRRNAVLLFTTTVVAMPVHAQETIVAIRHAEKPPGGLGQLTCRGLNRALALPKVLIGRFGKPDAIYAPDPADEVMDGSNSYSYVRPLVTIEPTAIALGMPVNTQIGYGDICPVTVGADSSCECARIDLYCVGTWNAKHVCTADVKRLWRGPGPCASMAGQRLWPHLHLQDSANWGTAASFIQSRR
jgi:hypothetical protein